MRPSYRQAIAWIADNDDTSELRDPDAPTIVTVALVADLFGKTDEKVRQDVLKCLDRGVDG